MIPLFVLVRDRLSPLQKLVTHLETVPGLDIILVDNASTYEPLVEYLRTTPHFVKRLGYNGGHHGPWDTEIIPRNTFFAVTDPDVVPLDSVPKHYPEYMIDVLKRHPELIKVGFSLRIDNLPDHYMFKGQAVAWESQFWYRYWHNHDGVPMYDAPLDTTFAFYNPNRGWDLAPSVRVGAPYIAEHLAWYADSANPTEEEVYYKEHANRSVASWLYDDMSQAIRANVGF